MKTAAELLRALDRLVPPPTPCRHSLTLDARGFVVVTVVVPSRDGEPRPLFYPFTLDGPGDLEKGAEPLAFEIVALLRRQGY